MSVAIKWRKVRNTLSYYPCLHQHSCRSGNILLPSPPPIQPHSPSQCWYPGYSHLLSSERKRIFLGKIPPSVLLILQGKYAPTSVVVFPPGASVGFLGAAICFSGSGSVCLFSSEQFSRRSTLRSVFFPLQFFFPATLASGCVTMQSLPSQAIRI